ncbi:MAG: hypothetical protein WHV66_05970, partial [Anaerolineales bacterium]
GKTTQANLLATYLRKQGIRVRRVWLRFPFFLSIPLLAYARLCGYSWYQVDNNVRHGYWNFRYSWVLQHILPWTLLCDAALAAIVHIYLPMAFGTTIVCERFVLDMLVDLSVAGAIADFRLSLPVSLYLRLLPKNAFVCILTLDNTEEIRRRRSDLRTDQRLAERLNAFENLARHLRYPLISSQLSVEEVFHQLLSHISEPQ